MIFDTDVQCAFHNFGEVARTVVMVTGAAALKSIHVLADAGQNPLVVLYDTSTTGGIGASTEVTTFFAGIQSANVSNGMWFRIPGNGLRFNDGIVIDVTTTTLQSVALLYQGGA